MKVKIVKPVIQNVNGKSVSLKEGEVYDLPAEAARHLINGGYGKTSRAAAKVKVQPKGKPLNTKSVKGG